MYLIGTLVLLSFSTFNLAGEKIQSAANTHPNITFYTESYPPANYMEQNKLVGISVDMLKLMWAEQGISEQQISMVSWNRGYRKVLKSPNTALFTISRTPAREHLFKWVGPLFQSNHVLFAKKSSNLKFQNLSDVLSHSVATIHGDISEISLQQIGFPDYNMAKADNLERAFRMMESDRVEMIMVSIHGFEHLSKLLNIDTSDYEQVWKVNQFGNYIGFNVNTPDSVIQKYQQAFNSVKSHSHSIRQKYMN